jgi:hypothetical protein
MRIAVRSILAAALGAAALVAAGCGGPTGPREAPQDYQRLLQLAAAEAQAQEDSTFLWLRNPSNREARALMLDLDLDYLRYDRVDGVVCVWKGGGVSAARGYVYRLPGSRVPTDFLGETCYRYDACSESDAGDGWTRFQCT